MSREWAHDELQRDLVECRRACGEIAAEKLGLGSWGGSEQLDVAAIRPSWSQPRPTAYEVKVTRSDFRSDVRSTKYARYQPFVSRVFYAVPSGLVSPDELPAGVGLIVRGPNGWSVRKAAPARAPDPEKLQAFVMAMLFKDQDAPWKPAGRAERIRLAGEGSLYELGRKGMERVRGAMLDAKDAKEMRAELNDVAKTLREAMPDYPYTCDSAGFLAHEAARRLGAWCKCRGAA